MADRKAAISAQLTSVMAELSGYSEAELSSTGTFLELGFDSLFLTQLATAFQKEFATPISFRQLITDQPTPNALAAWIAEKTSAPTVEPTPEAPSEALHVEAAAGEPSHVDATVTATGNRNADDMTDVFSQQLDLMRAQLEFLRGKKSAAASPTPVLLAKSSDADQLRITSMEKQPEAPPTGFGPRISKTQSERELTPSQSGHIDRLIARYNAKTRRSKEHATADRAFHADPRTAAGFDPLWKEMVYPIVVNRSKGAHLWDIDDNQYIDLLNGFGPNFFGHRAGFITDALKAQLDDGFETGPQTPHAGEAAKLLCELTGMDRASWVNTGSEAVQAAIRIARTVTGRDKIVVFKGSYHGNFDEVLVRGVNKPDGGCRTLPVAPGIPFGSVDNVIVLEYGDDAALEAIAADVGSIAAVLVEPVQSRRPDLQPREFLHALRDLTERNDVALIFDEVITGFRTGPGGAQEYFGVKADLATYGKILGGGMPIGAVAGSAKYMDTFDGGAWGYGDASKPEAGVTFFAGTFVRHPLAIAAAYASLKHLQEQGAPLQERVTARAARFADELNEFFEERGVGFRVLQFSSQMFIRVDEETPLATLFFYHMRDRGVHLLEGFPCYMTAAHTDDDVTAAIDAAKDAIFEMQADGVLSTSEEKQGDAQSFMRRLPLTAGQRVIWSTAQLGAAASCAFNESDSFHLDGDLDRDAFAEAVNASIDEHEAFRLRFDSAGAHQLVADTPGFALQFLDIADLPSDKQRARIDDWVKHAATTSLDLEHGPLGSAMLFRLGAEAHIFIVFAHHLVFDGYSSDLLIRDIVRLYGAIVEGERIGASDLAPFSDYVPKAQAASPVPDFWRSLYAEGAPPPLDLPTDTPRGEAFTYRGATARRTLPNTLCEKVRSTARDLGVTMSAITMSAYAAWLSGISGRPDFIVGLPAAGQARHGIETVGYCVNVLPMLMRVAGDLSFGQFAKNVQEITLDAFENQDLSLSALKAGISEPSSRHRPLIDAMFNYGGYFRGLDVAGVHIRAVENERHAVCNELFLNISDDGDALCMDLEYASDLFGAATIETWLDDFSTILSNIGEDATIALATLTRPSGDGQANVVLFETHRVRRDDETGAQENSATLNATEVVLVSAVGVALGQDDISIEANFFELGGHSIHASRLLTALRKSIAPTLGIRAIFEAASLRALAAHIDGLESETEIAEREEFVF